MTPCNPRAPLAICPTCERHMPRIPHGAECRPTAVCIDASVTAVDGRRPLFESKPGLTLWPERTDGVCSSTCPNGECANCEGAFL